MRSINRQLLVLLLAALTVAAMLIGVSSYLEVHEEISELFDYQLRQIALSYRDQNTFDQQPAEVSNYEKDEGLTVQVWDASGALIYVSRQNCTLPRASTNGLQTISAAYGGEWRVYRLTNPGRIIQVSQSFAARHNYQSQPSELHKPSRHGSSRPALVK